MVVLSSVDLSHVQGYHMHVTVFSCAFTFVLLGTLENWSMQKKGNISNDDRTAKACETQQPSKIDYGNRSSVRGSNHSSWTNGRMSQMSANIPIYSVQSETARLYKEFVH